MIALDGHDIYCHSSQFYPLVQSNHLPTSSSPVVSFTTNLVPSNSSKGAFIASLYSDGLNISGMNLLSYPFAALIASTTSVFPSALANISDVQPCSSSIFSQQG